MPKDRTIGLFFAAVALVLGLLPLLGSPPSVGRGALATGGAFALVALIRPGLLRPLNHLWMGLGRVFQRIFPPVFMTVFYWIVFTPIAVTTLISSRTKPVDLRWKDDDCESWWELRETPGPPPETVSRQY